MSSLTARRTSSGLLVSTLGVVMLSVISLAQPARPAFEVASIRPVDPRLTSADAIATLTGWARPGGVFHAPRVTAATLIAYAYDVKPYELVGGPEWMRRETFTVDARALRDASADEMKLMLQALLEDRFRLVTRTETRDIRFHALELAHTDGRLGPYLRRLGDTCKGVNLSEVRAAFLPRVPPPESGSVMFGSCGGIGDIADVLSITSDLPVLDRTGLTGRFAYEMRGAASFRGMSGALIDALEEQLGLTVSNRRGPIEVLVVEAIERPEEN